MNCKEAQSLFVPYLDNELDAAALSSLQEHLAGCKSCQDEAAAMAATRTSTRQALQHLAAAAKPSPMAWERLQERLVKEARPSPWTGAQGADISAHGALYDARGASPKKYKPKKAFEGVKLMHKRLFVTGLVALLAISLAVVLLARGATPVSAQLILERASAAQSAATPAQGVVHIRIESVQNLSAQTGVGAGESTIAESYNDLESGNIRWTVIDAASGRVLNAFAYDGTYTYSAEQADTQPSGTPLTIYRMAQRPEKLADATLNHANPVVDAKQTFEDFRSQPDVQLKAQETLPDGRSVYVLTAQETTKVVNGDTVDLSAATTTLTFDAQTYQILEIHTEEQKGDQAVVIVSRRYLANEILPTGTKVAWDLSDLPGVKIVDDPNGQHGEALPEKITQYDLNARVNNPYVLAPAPDGFTQEISATPNQPVGQDFAYVISYRNVDGDYIVIQPAAEDMKGMYKQDAAEIYTTQSGLTLYFEPEIQSPQGKQVTGVLVVAPDGASFLLNSTLPKERIKALAENLITSKG